MPLDILDLDLAASDGVALMAWIEHAHGRQFAKLASKLDRIFLLRSDWAPGLRFVGAQINARRLNGHSLTLSVGGCGLSLERAFASCLGEAAERLSQVERDGDVSFRASLLGVANVPTSVGDLCRTVLEHAGISNALDCDWIRCADLAGKQALVPADWCLRRANPGAYVIAGAAVSVGCAAGQTLGSARERALLELVERDAVSLWWEAGRPAAALSLGQMPEVVSVLSVLRGPSSQRRTEIIDLTTELPIPVVAAYSTDRDGGRFACGFASRRSAVDASAAAVIELCQMEVGLQLASISRHKFGEVELNDQDKAHLSRAAGVNVRKDRRFIDRHVRRDVRVDGQSALNIQEFIEAAVSEVFVVDLTRADIGVPVIKAIAPDLQLAPCEVRTNRFHSALAANRSFHPNFVNLF